MKNTFILTLVFLFSITTAFACTCIEIEESLSKKIEKAFSESDLIISGKVIDIKIVNKNKVWSSADPVIYKIEVFKITKGETQKDIIEIVSERSGASCGYKFDLNSSYLIYTRKSSHFSSETNNEFDIVTSLCDRNQKLENTKKKELRKLKKMSYKEEKINKYSLTRKKHHEN